MKYEIDSAACREYGVSSRLEWLLPNGIGGFASGTVSGANTRRYHGHLVAAVKPPTDRLVLVAGIEAHVTIAGVTYGLSTNQYVGTVHPQGYSLLKSFSVGRQAEWVFSLDGHLFTKTLAMHEGSNTCTVRFYNLGSQNAALSLKPLVSHKFFHDNFRVTDFYPQFLVFPEGRTVLTHNSVSLHIEHPDADRIPTTGWYYRFEHPRESERGLDPIDDLYCPCDLKYSLGPGQVASIVLSTHEGAEPIVVQDDKCAVDANLIDCLGDACSKFLVRAPGRTTIIAGYPWFADWGRDTMVALPGVCLARGLVKEAQEILRSYAGSMADGLIPNRFSDEGGQPEYNTADASLWFVNAVYQTLDVKPDMEFAIEAFKWVGEVYESHMRGTKYGIQVDPEDGLLKQGAPGVQLTWMDAKVGDWVVTPRHGKPVEVNALWINACRVLEWLADLLKLDSSRYRASADLAENSFVVKFWKESVGHFLDTVNPDDASFRPNQLIALSLPKGPNVGDKAVISLKKIKSELIACGVRTLSSTSPGYHGQFEGSLSERDAAYHQGTAWPWLLGPYVLAVLKHLGDVDEARRAISPARQWLETYGLGGIPEVFDGSEPYLAGGCPWQAWSASELLRAALAIQQFEFK